MFKIDGQRGMLLNAPGSSTMQWSAGEVCCVYHQRSPLIGPLISPQIYGCCHPDNSASLCGDFGICVADVARWMCSNRLQLNARKTEFMWCVPPRRRHQLPVDQLTIQSTSVASRESVRDLGVYLDSDMSNSDMSMHKHVTQLVCSCYGVLRQLRSIRRSLPRTALTTFSSFIMSKVDYGYCNVVLAWQVYHNVNWTVCSRSSTRLPACQQTLANTTT